MNIAESLLNTSRDTKDHETAGFTAYVLGGLQDQSGNYIEAAKSYQLCSDHYEQLGSAAQSIQCEYKSGLSYLAGYQDGRGKSTLENVIKRLEVIGEDDSAFASQVYLTLAEETLPSKIERAPGANSLRLKAAEYAAKSMGGLEKSNQTDTEYYAAAAYMRGLALEDSRRFPDAVAAYETAIETYSKLPSASDDDLRNMVARLNVARTSIAGPPRDDQIDVQLADGEVITLNIKKRRDVKVPKLNRNQLVDGAQATVRIALDKDGKVANVDVIDTMPTEEYGEALGRAVKTWTFSSDENVSLEDIPNFNYSVVFAVKRL